MMKKTKIIDEKIFKLSHVIKWVLKIGKNDSLIKIYKSFFNVC